MSFLNDAGHPVAHDPKKPGQISDIAGAFSAGIMRHMAALTAFTAPSPISSGRRVATVSATA
ncbi:MAG: hypothetical protein ACEQSX_17810 [Baekduiaceae bacterium]